MAKLVFSYTRILQEVFHSNIFKPRINYAIVRHTSNTPSQSEPQRKDDTDIGTYVRRDDEFRVSKFHTIQRLQRLFGINEFQAIDIASEHRSLCAVNGHLLTTNCKLCVENGVKHNTILKCVGILGLSDLEERITILKDLQQDLNEVAPLLRLRPQTLINLLIRFKQSGNTLNYLSKTLQTSKFYLAEQYVKKPFLQKITKEKIQQVTKVLFDYGISGSDIANDLVSLNYSVGTIEARMLFARENNVEDIKTWMIRADPKVFENYVKIRSEHKSILGDKSVAEYLSERLDCSLQVADYLVLKQPALNNKSVKKIEEIIDYIIEQGYTPSHICRVPKILLHSFDTIKKRIKQLQEKNIRLESLYMLIKSQNKFDHYLSMYEKTRSKRLQNM